jgi:diguanylate cyclase (GGDEF)-like protein
VEIRSSFGNRAVKDALLLAVIGVVLWFIAVSVNFHDHLDHVLHQHEAWQLDELFDAVNVTGLLGLIYAARRINDLKAEIRLKTRVESNMDWLINHDPLTSLPNRSALNAHADRIERSEQNKPYVIYSLDLDGFKKINDLVGHQGGDILLRAAAKRLQTILPNAKIFRLGGDEFLAISPRDATLDCLHLGRTISETLSAPYDVGGMTSEIGASIGFALYPDNSTDFNDAIHCADVAMFAAKKAGENNVIAYERIMEDRVVRRAETEMALKRAIRDQAIVPYYQPVVDLKSGKVHGFEALARWKTGPGQYIPPSDFIEFAESAGLIIPLSDSLLKQACLDALHWPDSVRLAFNISPIQFIDSQLGLRIMAILAETGYPPHRLEIEITETAIIHDVQAAADILRDLRKAGIKLALDDFGTGYSNLSQLSQFQFDKLKIDRSFVINACGDTKHADIVRGIMGLSQGLGLATTAEGIEDEQQLEFLKGLGCDFGQGYLFSKGLPAEQALVLLSQDGHCPTLQSSVA